jgi:nucleotide-binding universal stress UspA family protein
MRILISYDGSNHADAALADLHRAGLPAEAQAVVISIPSALQGNGSKKGGDPEAEAEQAAELAQRGGSLVRRQFPGWDLSTDLAIGSAVSVLAKKARQWRPDLIILGLNNSTASPKARLGRALYRIAEDAKCSVRLTRGFHASDEAPRALLCVDGSKYTAPAVRAVALREWPKGTEIRIFTAVDPFEFAVSESVDRAIQRAKSLHRTIAGELNRTPAFTSSIVREGDPRKLILGEADQWKADSIFLAPRRNSRLARLAERGVSSAVMAEARCGVELARETQEDPGFALLLRSPQTMPLSD